MPKVKASFSLKSKSPNFERDSFPTKESMRNMNISHMDEGHISYCKETKKHYTFSTYNQYDPETGYFKLLETGGGGLGEDAQQVIDTLKFKVDELGGNINELSNDVGEWEENNNITSTLKDILDKVNELYNEKYQISCSLSSPSGTVFEFKPNRDKITFNLNISVSYKGASLDRSKIDSLSIAVTEQEANSPNCTIGTYDKSSTSVQIEIPSYYNSKYKFTLTVVSMGQTKTATCTIYQRAPMFAGWSDSPLPNEAMCVEANTDLFKRFVTTTSVGQKANYTAVVPKSYYFWTLVPNNVANYKTALGNEREAVMTEINKFNDIVYNDELDVYQIKKDSNNGVVYLDFKEFKYRGVTYNCRRQPTPAALASQNWLYEFK